MTILEKINAISEEARGQLKPDLEKYGKNFRAISESAVLDVLMPLLKKHELTYIPEIIDSKLRVEKIGTGSNAAGAHIQSLVFIAECKVRLKIFEVKTETILKGEPSPIPAPNSMTPLPYIVSPAKVQFQDLSLYFDGWGSGVDDGDKATGKAYTAAVKYALFKGFKLQYSDDPDAKKSERIDDVGVAPEEISSKSLNKKEEPTITENMLKYLKGLAIRLKVPDDLFLNKYGYHIDDRNMPMRVAREAIDELNKMPF